MELDHPQNTFESIRKLQSKYNLPNFQGGFTNKKYNCKYIKIWKIGAMLR
jgi:hypothetical protein